MGVPFGHVASALLVAHEDMTNRRINDRVINRQDRSAGIAEYDLDPFEFEALYEGLGPVQSH